MSKTRRIVTLVIIAVIVLLSYAFYFGLQYAYIGSSYNAKTVCSCMFVSGRDLASIKAEDLYAVPYSNISVDEEKQTVEVDIYGLAKTKAIFRRGLGCTLVNEVKEEDLRKQPGLTLADVPAERLSSYDTIPASIDIKGIQKTVNDAFEEKANASIMRARAVVILYKGKIVVEKYAANIKPGTPLLGWSMTKSVTNAMTGLLVKEGKIDVSKPAQVSEWQNDKRKNITTDALLRMSSGLAFIEDYSKPSDATKMLFRKKDAGAYALASHYETDPGTKWYYSSGTTNILQEIIRRQFKTHEEYLAFPHVKLFRKIGMNSAVIEPDASGTYVGSSFMYATAQDWARFGQLYLQDGIWNGERILPEGWVSYSSKETPHSDGKYAAQFWINHTDRDFPQDAFFADGFEGQFVTIVPSKHLVIVRLGCTPKSDFDNIGFVKNIVKAVH